jgi:acyl-Coa thioesterase superfamily protein/acyl-CoA thioesterase superfamily protein
MTERAPGLVATRFAEGSALVPAGSGWFGAELHPEWTIGGKPNGGYLLAILGRAAQAAAPHPDVIAASAHYLRPPEPGPVAVEVEVLRTGRTASQVRARMVQQDRSCVEALLTTGSVGSAAEPYWDRGLPSVRTADYADCVRLAPRTPDGSRVAVMDQVEVRLDPASAGFTRGKPSGRGELRGWLALPGGDSFDPVALLYAADAFPPATFDIEFSGWVPTLELTVYVRGRPAPGPVRVLHRCQLINAGRVDENCFIWDSAGRLVAHGTQLAAELVGS